MKSALPGGYERRRVVAMNDHALGTLQYIRASIDAAGSLAVPGLAGIVMGSIGVIAALLCAHPALARHWLAVWIGAAFAASTLGGSLLIRRTGLAGRTLRSAAVRRFALCLTPALGAGALLTGVLWQRDVGDLIPATWLVLYGCGIVAAGTATLALVSVMGTLFMIFGVLAFMLPSQWSNMLLGLGFGGLHLAFGFFISRMNHGDETQP